MARSRCTAGAPETKAGVGISPTLICTYQGGSEFDVSIEVESERRELASDIRPIFVGEPLRWRAASLESRFVGEPPEAEVSNLAIAG